MEKIQLAIPCIDSTKLGELELLSQDGVDLVNNLELEKINAIHSTVLFDTNKILLDHNFQENRTTTLFDTREYLQLCTKQLNTFLAMYNANTSFSLLKYSFETPQKKLENVRLARLKIEFQMELKNFGHYIKSDKEKAIRLFDEISEQLAKINYDEELVELTPSNSFKIKLSKGKSLLVITKPFHEIEDLKEKEVVFSIFEDKKCLFSNAIDIFDLVKDLNDSLVD